MTQIPRQINNFNTNPIETRTSDTVEKMRWKAGESAEMDIEQNTYVTLSEQKENVKYSSRWTESRPIAELPKSNMSMNANYEKQICDSHAPFERSEVRQYRSASEWAETEFIT